MDKDELDLVLFNTDDYIKKLIPDLSYFSHYEKMIAFNKKENMIDDLFIRHELSSNGEELTKLNIESYRCLLLSDFDIEMVSNIGSYFAEIGPYGDRKVYCYYKNDEDDFINENDSFNVKDDDKYDDKFIEELRF